MILIIQPKLLRKNFDGITVWPFVIVRKTALCKDLVFLNHERIHLRQQLELLIIFFHIWYALEFIIRWAKYKNRNLAYRNISFEQEAYENEKDLLYLKKRSFWAFLKYM